MPARIVLTSRAKAAILWIIAGVALLFLWQVRGILSPFVWAIVTAYVANPLLVWLARRTGLPRRLLSVGVSIVVLGLLIWGISVLVPALTAEAQLLYKELPQHVRETGKLIGQTNVDLLGVQINLNGPDEEIRKQMGQALSALGRDFVPGALPHVAETLLKVLLYLFASFFLLLEADRIGPGISSITPEPVRAELGPWVSRINDVLGAYIRGQLFLVVLMSVTSYIALTILGVRFAPLLAIFTGLVETMPFIGPYIAGGTAVLVALTQGTAPFGWSSLGLGLAVALTYTALRQIEDNVVMPFVIGRLVHLHPLVVIFSVLAGASLAGILGLLLAVPVAATIKIIATYLYRKLNEQPPRTLVLVEPEDNWETLAERIREHAVESIVVGGGKPRLLLSAPAPFAAMLDPQQFHRLPALARETNADLSIFTTDPALTALASEAGLHVQSALDPEPGEAPGEVGLDEIGEPKRKRKASTATTKPAG